MIIVFAFSRSLSLSLSQYTYYIGCHDPDMNLQMCTHLENLSESERRSEICQLRSEAVV